MRIAIVTVSDSAFVAGGRVDTSGDAIQRWAERRGDTVVSRAQVEDDASKISALLESLCDSGEADLVLSTGGTGLAPRDVTPEATLAVIEREAQGIAEYLRVTAFGQMPRAALSRGVAGVRGRTLIVNLPGSTSATQDGLATLQPIIEHAIGILTGTITRHVTPPAERRAF